MSDPTKSLSQQSIESSKPRRGRVRVRKKVRVRTMEAQIEDHRSFREKAFLVLFYVGMTIGSLLLIWFGLNLFVREPSVPRDPGSVMAVDGTRSAT